MLLMIIFILLLIVGIVLVTLGNSCFRSSDEESNNKNLFIRLRNNFVDFVDYHDDGFCLVGAIVIFVSILCIVIALCCIISSHANQEAALAQKQATYEALVFKAESEVAKDEFGLLNKEIIDEIQAWNEDVIFVQGSVENPWVNWYYAPYYKELKTIDLNSFK